MILHVARCPECGGTSFAVEVKSWVNIDAAEDHSDEYPRFDSGSAEFDQEDAAYAEPLDDGDIICRSCGHAFKNTAPVEAAAAAEA